MSLVTGLSAVRPCVPSTTQQQRRDGDITMADSTRVTGGVDTHKDFHVAGALDEVGRVLGTESFPTSAAGYKALLGWLAGFGELAAVGVEGTGAWGAGLARFLTN